MNSIIFIIFLVFLYDPLQNKMKYKILKSIKIISIKNKMFVTHYRIIVKCSL